MPTPTRGSWPGGGASNASVEAAPTAEIDEQAFTDLFGQGCPGGSPHDDGSIEELVVMIRPLSGVVALADAMKAERAIAKGPERT